MEQDGTATTAATATTMDVAAVPRSSIRTGKPLRVMLPRGASCTICRRRKVKCDGVKPHCSQCIKSSTSTTASSTGGLIKCVYETPAAASARSSTGGEADDSPVIKKKRPRKSMTESSAGTADRDSEDGTMDRQRSSSSNEFRPLDVDPMTTMKAQPKKRKSGAVTHAPVMMSSNGAAPGPGGDRVEALVSRIGELERRLVDEAHVVGSESQEMHPTLPLLPAARKQQQQQHYSGIAPSGSVYSPHYQQHLPAYLASGPVSTSPSSPGSPNSYGLSHSAPQSSMLVSQYSHHQQITYQQQQQQQQQDQSRAYFTPPTSAGNGSSSSNLPSLMSVTYPLPPNSTPYSSHYGANGTSNGNAGLMTKIQDDGYDMGALDGGAMLERRASSRSGFDESDTRSSTPVMTVRSLADLAAHQQQQQQQQHQHSNPISTSGDRRTNHYASFIPIDDDLSSSHPSPVSIETTDPYPFTASSLPAQIPSPASEHRSPSPVFALSFPSILHQAHPFSPYSTAATTSLSSSEPQLSREPLVFADIAQASFSMYQSQIDPSSSHPSRQLIPFPSLLKSPAAQEHDPYPASLPPYDILVRLVRVFFVRASVPSSLFDKARFLRAVEGGKFWAGHYGDDSLAHGAEGAANGARAEWPEEALLHAICGFSCVFVGQDALGTPYWCDWATEEAEKMHKGRAVGAPFEIPKNDKHNSMARAYHFDMAKRGIDRAVAEMGSASGGSRGGRGLFQVLQASIISAYIAYASASFTSLWLLCGIATRLCTPLGLNHLAPWDYVNGHSERTEVDWKKQGRSGGFFPPGLARRASNGSTDTATDPGGSTIGLWGPPTTREEHYERTITFWTAFSIDRHASASTDWSTSIDELDITTLIPCLGPAPKAALSINHPEFLNEFAKPVNSVGRYVKAVVLLGRVVNYIQRLPRFEDLQHDRNGEGRTASEFMRSVKATPAFLQLDAALGRFRTATSGMLFDKGDHVDGHLASAYVVPHAASILLHEIFTDPLDRSSTSSIARCLASAKCIVNSTYLLYESSNDLSGCDPFLPFCWSIVSRSLIRDHAIKSSWGEHDAANISRGLAEHCLGFTSRCAKLRGTPIAKLLTDNLRAMLDGTAPSTRRLAE